MRLVLEFQLTAVWHSELLLSLYFSSLLSTSLLLTLKSCSLVSTCRVKQKKRKQYSLYVLLTILMRKMIMREVYDFWQNKWTKTWKHKLTCRVCVYTMSSLLSDSFLIKSCSWSHILDQTSPSSSQATLQTPRDRLCVCMSRRRVQRCMCACMHAAEVVR